MTSSNSLAFASSEAPSRSSAGSRSLAISPSAARWTADGKTSFDDWPMFTSSFAWTPSPASEAITSFAFMFEDVPEPVWKTSIGNWSSSSPFAIRSAAAAMRSAFAASRSPSSPLTRAAAALIRPSHRATGVGMRSPDTGKLEIALRVSPPHSSLEVDAVSVTAQTLAGGAYTPVSKNPFSEAAAKRFVQLFDHRPPDVRAARAFVLGHLTTLAAVEAFDHGGTLRSGRSQRVPLSGGSPSRFQQVLPGRQLHARTAPRLARGPLGGVDRLPPRVLDPVHALALEERLERSRRRTGKPARARVLQQELDGLRRVLLVRADHAARAAFDP